MFEICVARLLFLITINKIRNLTGNLWRVKWCLSVSLQKLHRLQGSVLRLDQRQHLFFPQTWDQVWHLSISIYITTHTHLSSLYRILLCVTILTRRSSVLSFVLTLRPHRIAGVVLSPLCLLSLWSHSFFFYYHLVLIYFFLCHSSHGYFSDSRPSRPPAQISHILFFWSGSPWFCLRLFELPSNICAL